MKYKKEISLLMLLGIILSLMPAIIAQEDDWEEREFKGSIGMEKDIEFFQYRIDEIILHLEEKIAQGYEVIDKLKEKFPDSDTSRLTEILGELEELLGEAKNLSGQEPSEELRDEYLVLKDKAKELVTEFRDIASSFLPSQQEREQVREEVKAKVQAKRGELETKKNQIQEQKEEMKKEKLLEIYEMLEIDNPELLAKIRAGTATREELRFAAKNSVEQMSNEERQEIRNEWNDKKEKTKAEVNAIREQVREDIEAARAQLQEKREEWQRFRDSILNGTNRTEYNGTNRTEYNLTNRTNLNITNRTGKGR